MDCNICMEHKKMEEMEILNCCHFLCSNCLSKLTTFKCPYCREPFNNVIENEDYLTINDIEIDNIYPQTIIDNFNNNIIHSNRRYISQSQNRRHRNKNKGFRSNKDRECYERKKKRVFDTFSTKVTPNVWSYSC